MTFWPIIYMIIILTFLVGSFVFLIVKDLINSSKKSFVDDED